MIVLHTPSCLPAIMHTAHRLSLLHSVIIRYTPPPSKYLQWPPVFSGDQSNINILT